MQKKYVIIAFAALAILGFAALSGREYVKISLDFAAVFSTNIITKVQNFLAPSSDLLFKEGARIDVNALKAVSPDSKTAKRSRFMKINSNAFKTKTAGKEKIKERLRLNLFPGKTLTAVIEKSTETAPGKLLGRGKIENAPGSFVSLLSKGNRLLGHIYTAEGVYEIQPVRDDEYVVREIDISRLRDGHRERRTVAIPAERAAGIQSNEPVAVDLLALYTREARELAGGTQQIEDLIDFAAAETNLAYENSGVLTKLNVAAMREVNYLELRNAIKLDMRISQYATQITSYRAR